MKRERGKKHTLATLYYCLILCRIEIPHRNLDLKSFNRKWEFHTFFRHCVSNLKTKNKKKRIAHNQLTWWRVVRHLFVFVSILLSFEHFSSLLNFLLFLGDNLYSFDVFVSPHGVGFGGGATARGFEFRYSNNRHTKPKTLHSTESKKNTQKKQRYTDKPATTVKVKTATVKYKTMK